MELGVERLVLPAVPAVLETWTKCFGFEQMTNFDRSQFLDCAFLDFQKTVMCQKLLTGIPSPHSVLTRGLHLNRFLLALVVLSIKEIPVYSLPKLKL